MNVIFLDFDGTLDTLHDLEQEMYGGEFPYENVERRIALLADICKEYDAKVVIEAAAKSAIDEETMEIRPDSKWVKYIFSMFDKYGIECIGRTPDVRKYTSNYSYFDMWKEDEIRLFLFRHPEIDHYCVIDDDFLERTKDPSKSDLNKVRSHLVQTCYYNPQDEKETGLLERHRLEVGEALKQENEVKRLIKRRDRIKNRNNMV